MTLTQGAEGNWLEDARALREKLDESHGAFLDEAKNRGIQSRKAYYLVEIDRALDGYPISAERKLKIGWTKMQLIAPHLAPHTYNKLLDLADDHPVHELQKILTGDWPDSAQRCVLFYLSEKDYAVLEQVLKAHGGKPRGRGIQGKEEALMKALGKLLPPKKKG